MEITLNLNDIEINAELRKVSSAVKVEIAKINKTYEDFKMSEYERVSKNFIDYLDFEDKIKMQNVMLAAMRRNPKMFEKANAPTKGKTKQAEIKYTDAEMTEILAIRESFSPKIVDIVKKIVDDDLNKEIARILIDRKSLEGEVEFLKGVQSEISSDFWINQYSAELAKAADYFRGN